MRAEGDKYNGDKRDETGGRRIQGDEADVQLHCPIALPRLAAARSEGRGDPRRSDSSAAASISDCIRISLQGVGRGVNMIAVQKSAICLTGGGLGARARGLI